MHILTIYNASTKSVSIPGTSPIAPGAERAIGMPSAEFDPNFTAYLERAGVSGVGVDLPGSTLETTLASVGLAALSTKMFAAAGSIVATGNATVVAINNSGGYQLELPLAASVPAGTVLYVFNSTTSNDTVTIAVENLSGDTIDNVGVTPFSVTDALNTKRFTSDGVSDWATS